MWGRTIIMLAAMLAFINCTPITTSSFLETPHTPPAPEQPEEGDLTQFVNEALDAFDASNLSLPEKQARNAAVKVIRPFEDGHGSGTYVRMYDRFAVITAAHVVDNFATMIIEGRDDERVLGSVVYRDLDVDLAVILVPPLESRIAAPYRPKKNESNLIGANVNYTGFPGQHDLLTIRGHVASIERDMIVTNMFGWFGSSGSGVFDARGRLLGVVSGIDVGRWMHPIPLDSIVWVAPIWAWDEGLLKIRIKTAPPLEVFKSLPPTTPPLQEGAKE